MARKYTQEILQEAVENSVSWAGVMRSLGTQDAGGSRSNIQRNVRDFGIDTSHFTGQAHNKGKRSPQKKHFSEYLVLLPEGSRKLPTDRLRRAMLEYGFVYACCFENCPTHAGWINGPIGFEIDHISGNNIDNRPENLRFICAICHTQQPTSSHSWKNSSGYGDSEICECGGKKRYSSERCLKCHHTWRSQNKKAKVSKSHREIPKGRIRRPFPRKEKIEWPDICTLREMVLDSNYSQVGLDLGVSDNAVRKHMKKFEVDVPIQTMV